MVNIKIPCINMTIYTDASSEGWGISHNNVKNGGRWNICESKLHINCLELLAVFIGLKTFCKDKTKIHVRIMADNTTAVSHINNMGGTQSLMCNSITKDIWTWCYARDIWISAAHIPGVLNVEADSASRQFNDALEWMLKPSIFKFVTNVFGMPTIDLFASRNNRQIDKYVSWKPEPDAFAIDAFSLNWAKGFPYIFPPFSVLGMTISKIRREKVSSILIIPNWPTQTWFPLAIGLSKKLLHLPIEADTLILTHKPHQVHPLYPKLELLAIKT